MPNKDIGKLSNAAIERRITKMSLTPEGKKLGNLGNYDGKRQYVGVNAGSGNRSAFSRLSTVEKRAKANKKAAETRAANKTKRGKVGDAFAVPNSRK